MKWKTTKKVSDLKLDGIKFDVEQTDSTITAITMSDPAGNKVHLTLRSYAIEIAIPAPPELEKKHQLSYTLALIGDRSETFDEKHEAEARSRDLVDMYPEIRGNVSVKEIEQEIPF